MKSDTEGSASNTQDTLDQTDDETENNRRKIVSTKISKSVQTDHVDIEGMSCFIRTQSTSNIPEDIRKQSTNNGTANRRQETFLAQISKSIRTDDADIKGMPGFIQSECTSNITENVTESSTRSENVNHQQKTLEDQTSKSLQTNAVDDKGTPGFTQSDSTANITESMGERSSKDDTNFQNETTGSQPFEIDHTDLSQSGSATNITEGVREPSTKKDEADNQSEVVEAAAAESSHADRDDNNV